MRQVRVFSGLLAALLAGCTGVAPTDGAFESAVKPKPAQVPVSDNPYTLFETLQVRPLALSPSGKFLYAVNTPDGRLEIFRVKKHDLEPVTSVPVGLEPVAVAARSDDEVWVVNHLSDSVSIVDTSKPQQAQVVRTLLVGDEPRDLVFGGVNHDRAFITTAHRGQNSPDSPDLFTSVGRADVWVFDANNLGAAAGGTRLTKITLFADTPRALAVTPNGKTVYAAAFFSGNQTTSVSVDAVKHVYGGMPLPNTITIPGLGTIGQPPTGLIVKNVGGKWLDAGGQDFSAFVKVSLPDKDVFAIDATANPPVAGADVFAHVGTTLFNMAVNPSNGKLYVTNTDAHNEVRFEGHNAGVSSVRGNIVDSRISVIDPAAKTVGALNLNPHINHAADTGDASLSMAFPLDLAFSCDGTKVYVVAQGSAKLAVYDTAQLEAGNLAPSAGNQVLLAAGGPTGVVLDGDRDQAFVLTRFDNGISIVNTRKNNEVAHVTMFNPEPKSVTDGRQYLYDATHTSAHGDQACASCHVGGDFDQLAWDLGNPGGIPLKIADSHLPDASDIFTITPAVLIHFLGNEIAAVFTAFMPLKGPMTTQSLRGMDNHGSMHWRGDRNGAIQQNGSPFLDGTGHAVVSAQPNAGIFDEVKAFTSFNVAFPGLIGNPTQLSDADMSAFATFILQVSYPPNPIRNLDNSLTPEQAAGQAFFFNKQPNGAELPSDRFHNCNGCHVLDPAANAGLSRHPGFFGTDGRLSFENEAQIFKVPHLRNVYQKVGMFGSSPDPITTISVIPPLNPTVEAIRGFGYQHDGVIGSPDHFFANAVFLFSAAPVQLANGNFVPPNPGGIPLGNNPNNPFDFSQGFSTQGFATRHALSSFMFAFDSNQAPIVGQQITLTGASAATANPRIDLLEARANAHECDLVVHGRVKGNPLDYTFANGVFVASSGSAALGDASLRAMVGTKKGPDALTFTCTPPGSGWRAGVDRDGDGFTDADELAWGSDPASAASHP